MNKHVAKNLGDKVNNLLGDAKNIVEMLVEIVGVRDKEIAKLKMDIAKQQKDLDLLTRKNKELHKDLKQEKSKRLG